MASMSDIQSRREAILRIAASHGAHEVRLFGSVVRGESGPGSDVDILVRLDDDRSLIDQVALKRKLEELLGGRVDVVPEEALHRSIREQVLREAVTL